MRAIIALLNDLQLKSERFFCFGLGEGTPSLFSELNQKTIKETLTYVEYEYE